MDSINHYLMVTYMQKIRLVWCFSWIEDTKYFHFTLFGKCLKFRFLAIDKSYPEKVM